MPKSDAVASPLIEPLELAVDARDLARDGRGIGTYARALVSRFAQRRDVRLTLLVREWPPRRAAPALRAALGVDAAAGVRLANRVPRGAEVVWHPWNGTFFESAAPAVATLHDLVPFALPATNVRLRFSQQAPFLRSARGAALLLCDSHFTASEAQRYLGVDRARLSVVPLGVERAFCPGSLDALPSALRGRRYVLYVGAHDPHKNVLTLAAAHRAAFAGSDVALVFTRPNPQVPDAVVCANVDRETLVALYRGAMLVAVPSTYEGFGLPVLEALACGTPVVAARAASLPEVGGEAVAYVDTPTDAQAWRERLAELAADSAARASLAAGGPARAAIFRWEVCASRTLEQLRAAARR